MLKNIKKTLNGNRDFRCITQNSGEGNKIGLRIAQDEDGIVCHNKESIEKINESK